MKLVYQKGMTNCDGQKGGYWGCLQNNTKLSVYLTDLSGNVIIPQKLQTQMIDGYIHINDSWYVLNGTTNVNSDNLEILFLDNYNISFAWKLTQIFFESYFLCFVCLFLLD